MTLTRRGNGAAQAGTNAAAVPHPAGTLAGDTNVMVVSGTTMPDDVSGWTTVASGNAGGAFTKMFTRVAPSNAPADVSVNLPSSTKMWAGMYGWYPSVGNTVAVAGVVALDSDTSSTAFSASSTLDVATGDIIDSYLTAFAQAAGTFSANPGTNTISHSAATMGTAVGNFGSRTNTNTTAYAGYHRPVTTGAAGTATLSVTLAGANAAGTAALFRLREVTPPSNVAPTANAGPDQTVASGATVTLTGAGSSDSDGTIASYSWALTSGPAATLSSSSAVSPTFAAGTGPSTRVFTLTVTDDGGLTGTDTVTINTSAPAGNNAPTVTADKDVYQAGEIITFTVADSDGTVSSVAVTGFSSNPAVSGSGGTRTAVAPILAADTTGTVTVTDNGGATGTDTFVVKASNVWVGYGGSVVRSTYPYISTP